MRVELNDIGKKFNRNWIFKGINFTVESGDLVSITGHNGSGKSTLIQIISGFITASKGQVTYSPQLEDIQTSFGFVAPYQNLIEEFTLLEHLTFHANFKKAILPPVDIIERAGLKGNEDKVVKEFSSGMKQRLRLSLAFFCEAEIIFLDEPTANLDKQGEDWYQQLILDFKEKKTIFIASNQDFEIQEATKNIFIEKFKV